MVSSWRVERARQGHHDLRRSMAPRTEARDPITTEFHRMFRALGLPQRRIARLFGVGARSVRRWRCGDRRVPRGVSIVFRLLAGGIITTAEVEQAAILVPTRTNGRANPEPLLVESASAPATLARAEGAALADSGLTTAEKIIALGPTACRWPHG